MTVSVITTNMRAHLIPVQDLFQLFLQLSRRAVTKALLALKSCHSAAILFQTVLLCKEEVESQVEPRLLTSLSTPQTGGILL